MQLQRTLAALETAQTCADVLEEACFTYFAIVDDVEADLELASDDVKHGIAHASLQPLRLGRGEVGVRAFAEQLAQLGRLPQTAGMRREDPIGAPFQASAACRRRLAGRPHRREVAISAPSTSAASFAH